jgi:hypothetical protein
VHPPTACADDHEPRRPLGVQKSMKGAQEVSGRVEQTALPGVIEARRCFTPTFRVLEA